MFGNLTAECVLQEVRETRRRQERRVVEVDSGTQQDYEFKLAQALQDLRRQHEEQVQIYKAELQQTFMAKVRNPRFPNKLFGFWKCSLLTDKSSLCSWIMPRCHLTWMIKRCSPRVRSCRKPTWGSRAWAISSVPCRNRYQSTYNVLNTG